MCECVSMRASVCLCMRLCECVFASVCVGMCASVCVCGGGGMGCWGGGGGKWMSLRCSAHVLLLLIVRVFIHNLAHS